jgi:hypothetical protein
LIPSYALIAFNLYLTYAHVDYMRNNLNDAQRYSGKVDAMQRNESMTVTEILAHQNSDRATHPNGEQAGADQPATSPADKVPAKIQPSTPTSKDGPR